jgi:hypothetical protein
MSDFGTASPDGGSGSAATGGHDRVGTSAGVLDSAVANLLPGQHAEGTTPETGSAAGSGLGPLGYQGALVFQGTERSASAHRPQINRALVDVEVAPMQLGIASANEGSIEQAGSRSTGRSAQTATAFLWQELDRMADQADAQMQSTAADITLATGMLVSVGYVFWNVRSLYLLVAMLLVKPLWSECDPEAVLDGWDSGNASARGLLKEEDEERELNAILG